MPLLAGEARLTRALASRSPDVLPEIVAADEGRGWMLMRDAGTPLRSLLLDPENFRLLDRVLPALAGVQMQWLGQQDELVRLGAFDRRLEGLPGQFAELARDRSALMVGEADGIEEVQARALESSVARVERICAQLAAAPVSQSIHYDDMHDANIFFRSEPGEDRLTLADWGESCAGHPFCSMVIFLRVISDRMGLPEESSQTPEGLDPRLARLRDAYLEPWQKFASQPELVEIFGLAWRAGMIGRALTWRQVVQALGPDGGARYRYTVPAWLGEFLLTL